MKEKIDSGPWQTHGPFFIPSARRAKNNRTIWCAKDGGLLQHFQTHCMKFMQFSARGGIKAALNSL